MKLINNFLFISRMRQGLKYGTFKGRRFLRAIKLNRQQSNRVVVEILIDFYYLETFAILQRHPTRRLG